MRRAGWGSSRRGFRCHELCPRPSAIHQRRMKCGEKSMKPQPPALQSQAVIDFGATRRPTEMLPRASPAHSVRLDYGGRASLTRPFLSFHDHDRVLTVRGLWFRWRGGHDTYTWGTSKGRWVLPGSTVCSRGDTSKSSADHGHVWYNARKQGVRLYGDANVPAPQGSETGHGEQESRGARDLQKGATAGHGTTEVEEWVCWRRTLTREAHEATRCEGARCESETPTRGPSGQWRPARWGGGPARTCVELGRGQEFGLGARFPHFFSIFLFYFPIPFVLFWNQSSNFTHT
jgi:hypothetical protein